MAVVPAPARFLGAMAAAGMLHTAHAEPTPCCHELQSVFELLNSVYEELEDPAAPHFQLCLSILETVAQVRNAIAENAHTLLHATCRAGCCCNVWAWHDYSCCFAASLHAACRTQRSFPPAAMHRLPCATTVPLTRAP